MKTRASSRRDLALASSSSTASVAVVGSCLKSGEQSILDILPCDLLVYVLCFLPFPERRNIRLLCKRMSSRKDNRLHHSIVDRIMQNVQLCVQDTNVLHAQTLLQSFPTARICLLLSFSLSRQSTFGFFLKQVQKSKAFKTVISDKNIQATIGHNFQVSSIVHVAQECQEIELISCALGEKSVKNNTLVLQDSVRFLAMHNVCLHGNGQREELRIPPLLRGFEWYDSLNTRRPNVFSVSTISNSSIEYICLLNKRLCIRMTSSSSGSSSRGSSSIENKIASLPSLKFLSAGSVYVVDDADVDHETAAVMDDLNNDENNERLQTVFSEMVSLRVLKTCIRSSVYYEQVIQKSGLYRQLVILCVSFSSVLKRIPSMPNLVCLFAKFCHELLEIEAMPNLIVLNLRGSSQLKVLPPVSDLPKLEQLNVSETYHIENIPAYPFLTYLSVRNSRNVQVQKQQWSVYFPRLVELHAEYSLFTPLDCLDELQQTWKTPKLCILTISPTRYELITPEQKDKISKMIEAGCLAPHFQFSNTYESRINTFLRPMYRIADPIVLPLLRHRLNMTTEVEWAQFERFAKVNFWVNREKTDFF